MSLLHNTSGIEDYCNELHLKHCGGLFVQGSRALQALTHAPPENIDENNVMDLKEEKKAE